MDERANAIDELTERLRAVEDLMRKRYAGRVPEAGACVLLATGGELRFGRVYGLGGGNKWRLIAVDRSSGSWKALLDCTVETRKLAALQLDNLVTRLEAERDGYVGSLSEALAEAERIERELKEQVR